MGNPVSNPQKLVKKIFPYFVLFLVVSRMIPQPVFAAGETLIPTQKTETQEQIAPYNGQNYQVKQAADLPTTIVFGAIPGLLNIVLGLEAAETSIASLVASVTEAGIHAGGVALGGDSILADQGTAYVPKDRGLLGATGAAIDGVVQNPPDIQTANFFKYTLSNNILAGKAYADDDKQGKDFLSPVLSVWQVTRDVSYVALVIMLVVAGLLVMLRRKTDPRTTLTVGQVLPRLVTSLILIAFSFPIAGVIFDVGRVLKALIDAVFKPMFTRAGLDMISVEPFQITGKIMTSVNFRNLYLGGSGLFSALLTYIIWAIILIVAFQLLFMLFTRYAQLFIQVVLAPFAFLWAVLPGQEDTMSSWFKGFVVNVLTFPIVYFLLNFALLILQIGSEPGNAFGLPPGMGAAGWPIPNAFSGAGVGFYQRNVAGLVAVGIVIAATKIPEVLENAFDIVPSGHVAKAGADPGKLAAKVPVIGGLLK